MRLAYVLESNSDRRTLEALSSRTDLTVVARQAKLSEFEPRAGRPFEVVVGPGGRARFGIFVAGYLARNRSRFDAVMAQGYGTAALGAGLAGLVTGRRPTLFIGNPMEAYYSCRRAGHWPDKPFRPQELAALVAVARANAQLAGRYATVSEYLGDVVRGHGTRAPVHFCPAYGVDLRVYKPSDRPREERRRELGLPVDDIPIVFFSSRVAPEKDAGTLLHAVAQLRSEGRDLWLLSTNREHGRLIAAAEELGLADRILAHDMVDPGEALARYYQASDVVVQASREEGLGISPLEALACGVPVVATAVGGLLETIRDGETGWSYPVGDSSALAAAIAEALDDPVEARRRTEAGARLVAERFESDASFDRLVELAFS